MRAAHTQRRSCCLPTSRTFQVSDSDRQMAGTRNIPALVRRVRDGGAVERATAASLVGRLCDSAPATQAALLAAGAAPALLELLQSRNAVAQWSACLALTGLAINIPEGAAAVAAAGGVAALARLLHATSDARVLAAVAAVLSHLAERSASNAVALTAANCVPRLLQLLRGGSNEVHARIANVLANIALRCGGGAEEVARGGGCSAGAAPAQQRYGHAGRHCTRPAEHAAGQPCHCSGDRGCRRPFSAAAPCKQPHDAHVGVLVAQALAQLAEHAPAPPAPPAPRRVCAAEGCRVATGLLRCAGCRRVRYCSVACGEAHLRVHRRDCRRWRAEADAAAAAAGCSSATQP